MPLFSLSCALLIGVVQARCVAQEQFTGNNLFDVSDPVFQKLPAPPTVYEQVKKATASGSSVASATALFASPFFVFEDEADGKLRVDKSDLLDGSFRVTIHLLRSPLVYRQRIADEVRRYAVTHNRSEYSNTEGRDIVAPPLRSISITPSNDPLSKRFTFQSPKSSFIYDTTFSLWTIVQSEAEADSLISKLQAKQARPAFDVTCQMNMLQTVSESTVHADNLEVSKLDAVQAMQGAGHPFATGVDIRAGKTVIDSDESYVTRDQKDAFEATLNQQISSEYVIENPKDLEVLRSELNGWIGRLFREKTVGLTNFQEEMKKLAGYDFSPDDLKPTEVTKLVDHAIDYMNSKSSSASSVGVNTSAKIFGFGGSLGVNVSKNEAHEILTKKGWDIGFDGTAYAAKSLTVYVVDKKTLTSGFSVNIAVSHRLRAADSIGEPAIDTSYSVVPLAAKGGPLAATMLEIQGKLAEDEKAIADLKGELVAQAQSVAVIGKHAGQFDYLKNGDILIENVGADGKVLDVFGHSDASHAGIWARSGTPAGTNPNQHWRLRPAP